MTLYRMDGGVNQAVHFFGFMHWSCCIVFLKS